MDPSREPQCRALARGLDTIGVARGRALLRARLPSDEIWHRLDSIQLQTSQRVDVLMFIISLAAMLFTPMVVILRKQGVRIGHTSFVCG